MRNLKASVLLPVGVHPNLEWFYLIVPIKVSYKLVNCSRLIIFKTEKENNYN